MAEYNITGKSVIVTGAGGGIGVRDHTRARQCGAASLWSTSPRRLSMPSRTRFPRIVCSPGGRCHQRRADDRRTDAAVDRFGRSTSSSPTPASPTIPPTTLAAADLDAYEKVIEVDLLGMVRTIKPALPEIIRNGGYVLITASIYAFVNGVINSAYAASKAAVEMLGAHCGWSWPPRTRPPACSTPAGLRPRSPTPRVATTRRSPSSTSGLPGVRWASSSRPSRSRPRSSRASRRAPLGSSSPSAGPGFHLRGAVNMLSDKMLEKDRDVLRLVRRIDSEERQRQAARARA